MGSVLENWERLINATLKGEHSRHADDLHQMTIISAIHDAADEVQDEDPTISRILCEQAYHMSHSLREGGGLVKLKSGVLSVLQQKLASRSRDMERLWDFYQLYKKQNGVEEVLRGDEDKWSESELSEMKKVVSTLKALVEAMKGLIKESPGALAKKIMEDEMQKLDLIANAADNRGAMFQRKLAMSRMNACFIIIALIMALWVGYVNCSGMKLHSR